MYTVKISNITKEYSIPDAYYYLKVEYEVKDSEGESLTDVRSIGLDVKSSQKEIDTELQKIVDVLNQEKEMKEINKEADMVDAGIVKISKDLKNKEYNSVEKEKKGKKESKIVDSPV